MTRETDFEKPRGVSRVEVRDGFAQVHVSRLQEPLMESRLTVLKLVADTNVSIDFLKLTPSGLSFLIAENQTEAIESSLAKGKVHGTTRPGRSIILVHAVNMRDDECLVASIVHQVIASGSKVDHISDMHDRLLAVVHTADAAAIAKRLEETLIDGASPCA
jgi:aspartokinase